jgi:hypothetical protein
VSRTRATFLKAELGFFGVDVYTRMHTPRFWGEDWSAGALVLTLILLRPFLNNWLVVGTTLPLLQKSGQKNWLNIK